MKRYFKYIAIALLVVPAVLLFGPLILLVVGIWRSYAWCRERILLSKLRPRALIALREVQETPLPAPLTVPPPRELNWFGGYVAGGDKTEIPRYLYFLKHGIATKAVILHYWAETGGGEHDSVFYYAFTDLKGRARIEKRAESVDAVHAGLARGRGRPVPSFDLELQVGTVLTVLLDPRPESDAHLIYESLLVMSDYVFYAAALERERGRPSH